MHKSVKEFLDKLDDFLESDARNLWVNTNDFKIYVRKSKRAKNGKLIDCLDLATIQVYEPGRGLFSELLSILIKSKLRNLYVESILNERFYNFLLSQGFEACGPMDLIKVFHEDFCERSPFNNGSCCCNCISRLELYKHPINKNELFKGSILESTKIYVCKVAFDCDSKYSAMVTEWEHSCCELHVWRPIVNKK